MELKLEYKIDKRATYLVAATYGPDSMALLDLLQRQGVKPVICAVNYHRTEDANKDVACLKRYCEDRGLHFEYFDTETLDYDEQYHEGEDYKKWAREVRYEFFYHVYRKYKAAALFLAHHQDDLLETYFAQKARQIKQSRYGLSRITTYNNMLIVRPMLQNTREDILEYNAEHNVPFDARVAAEMDKTVRSDIRGNVISKLTKEERAALIEEMNALNDETKSLVEDMAKDISEGDELEIRPLMALPPDAFVATLVHFVSQASEPIDLTPEMIDQIRQLCIAPQPDLLMPLSERTFLIKEYDLLTLGFNFDHQPYHYILEKPGKLSNENFDLDFSMGAEDRGIKAEDYPITIRTALLNDTYVVHGFIEKVRALYSAWKMPVAMRYVWPVFVNKDGKIIYVPRYRTNFREYHTSILKMHLKERKD
ncbi:MAG: tRNA lysidine(34) synthetase TilS [Bacilli bacterium]|nr:tRNA lysidine(34) synthetase TilS [Bacilli bacterium]